MSLTGIDITWIIDDHHQRIAAFVYLSVLAARGALMEDCRQLLEALCSRNLTPPSADRPQVSGISEVIAQLTIETIGSTGKSYVFV